MQVACPSLILTRELPTTESSVLGKPFGELYRLHAKDPLLLRRLVASPSIRGNDPKRKEYPHPAGDLLTQMPADLSLVRERCHFRLPTLVAGSRSTLFIWFIPSALFPSP